MINTIDKWKRLLLQSIKKILQMVQKTTIGDFSFLIGCWSHTPE